MADAWTPSADALVHGLFAYNVNGAVTRRQYLRSQRLESSPELAPRLRIKAERRLRNHNIYIARPGSDSVVRFNYIARASSHGIHLRNGGHLHDNLFVSNPINWQYGYGGDGNFGSYGLSSPGDRRRAT